MHADLVTRLLPSLSADASIGFNVFDVMHHGLHEKQISNVFRWLLDAEGTHGLDERFLAIFIDAVEESMPRAAPLPRSGYWVRQEVDTSVPGEPGDIADLVLECDSAMLVIENFYTSDGHGHDFDGYLSFPDRDVKQSVVVMLCRDVDRSLLNDGWEFAAVVTYRAVIAALHAELANDWRYQAQNPDAWSFIEQMDRKFVKGRGLMDDTDVMHFMVAMCSSGEAGRYREARQEAAADQFAIDVGAAARSRFAESRELLHRVKSALKSYCAGPLARQVNETLEDDAVSDVSARFAGIYQWTINFNMPADRTLGTEAPLQIKFGPSAWWANESGRFWKLTVPADQADYSRLFVTNGITRELRQSKVSIADVLAGLDPADRRLHDEIVDLMSPR
mgnify:CR=1 FL=1